MKKCKGIMFMVVVLVLSLTVLSSAVFAAESCVNYVSGTAGSVGCLGQLWFSPYDDNANPPVNAYAYAKTETTNGYYIYSGEATVKQYYKYGDNLWQLRDTQTTTWSGLPARDSLQSPSSIIYDDYNPGLYKFTGYHYVYTTLLTSWTGNTSYIYN